MSTTLSGCRQDPAFRLIGSKKVWERGAALTSRLQSFEKELTTLAVVRFYNERGTAEQWIKESHASQQHPLARPRARPRPQPFIPSGGAVYERGRC
jgi:hypothetical protein